MAKLNLRAVAAQTNTVKTREGTNGETSITDIVQFVDSDDEEDGDEAQAEAVDEDDEEEFEVAEYSDPFADKDDVAVQNQLQAEQPAEKISTVDHEGDIEIDDAEPPDEDQELEHQDEPQESVEVETDPAPELENITALLNSSIAPTKAPEESRQNMPPKGKQGAKAGKLPQIEKSPVARRRSSRHTGYDVEDMEDEPDQLASSPHTRPNKRKSEQDAVTPSPKKTKVATPGSTRIVQGKEYYVEKGRLSGLVQREAEEPVEVPDDPPESEEEEEREEAPAPKKRTGRPPKVKKTNDQTGEEPPAPTAGKPKKRPGRPSKNAETETAPPAPVDKAETQGRPPKNNVKGKNAPPSTAEKAVAQPGKSPKQYQKRVKGAAPARRSARNQGGADEATTAPSETTVEVSTAPTTRATRSGKKNETEEPASAPTAKASTKAAKSSAPAQKANTGSKRQLRKDEDVVEATADDNEEEEDDTQPEHGKTADADDENDEIEEQSGDESSSEEEMDEIYHDQDALFGVLPRLGKIFSTCIHPYTRPPKFKTDQGRILTVEARKCFNSFVELVQDDDTEVSHEDLWAHLRNYRKTLLSIETTGKEKGDYALKRDIYSRLFPMLLKLLEGALTYYRHEATAANLSDLPLSSIPHVISLIETILDFEELVAGWQIPVPPKDLPSSNVKSIRHNAIAPLKRVFSALTTGLQEEERANQAALDRAAHEHAQSIRLERQLRELEKKEAQDERQRWWTHLNALRLEVEPVVMRRKLITLRSQPWIWTRERDTDANGREFERVSFFGERGSSAESEGANKGKGTTSVPCPRPIPSWCSLATDSSEDADDDSDDDLPEDPASLSKPTPSSNSRSRDTSKRWSTPELTSLLNALQDFGAIPNIDAHTKLWNIFARECGVYGPLRRFGALEIVEMGRYMKGVLGKSYRGRGESVPVWVGGIVDEY